MRINIISFCVTITLFCCCSVTFAAEETEEEYDYPKDIKGCDKINVLIKKEWHMEKLLREWYLYAVTKDFFTLITADLPVTTYRVYYDEEKVGKVIKWEYSSAAIVTTSVTIENQQDNTQNDHFFNKMWSENSNGDLIFLKEEIKSVSNEFNVFSTTKVDVMKADKTSLNAVEMENSQDLIKMYLDYRFAIVKAKWNEYVIFQLCDSGDDPVIFVAFEPSYYQLPVNERLESYNELQYFYRQNNIKPSSLKILRGEFEVDLNDMEGLDELQENNMAVQVSF